VVAVRRSEAFLATSKEAPDTGTDVVALMCRAGLIREFGSGLYGFLPTGERVRRKITGRVEAAMETCGAQHVSLPALQYSDVWEASGRWANFEDEMFTLENRDGQAMCLAPSHEEGVVHLLDGLVRSHGDLPLLVSQVTEKYRDDHARNGLLRCKAFTMKDAYSVHADRASLDRTYERIRSAYLDVFDDLGLDVAVVAADNEVMGGHASEEFVAPVDDGSGDLVYCASEDCRFGRTDESAEFDEFAHGADCPDCGGHLATSEGIEVGHVFKLGTRYAEALDFTVDGPDGGRLRPTMGSYGIGVTRTLQTLLQQTRDRAGLAGEGDSESDGDGDDVTGCHWPVTDWGTVAPYRVAIVPLDYEDDHRAIAEELYATCGREDTLLFDDPTQSIGERFAECDLLGVPAVVVLGNHYTETGEVEVEYADGTTEFVDSETVPEAVAESATGN